MKKVMTALCVLLLAASLVACGNTGGTKETEAKSPETNPITDSVMTTAPTLTAPEESVDIANWGTPDTFSTNNGVDIDRYQIHVPKYLGSAYANAKISEHKDKTVAFISGQSRKTSSVENVADVFTAYMDNTIRSLQELYGIQSSNFQLTIDSSEALTIGDHEMYVHKGDITFDFDDVQRSYQYVAYATKLHTSGNCAYWMVYDISDDQSNETLIAEHAENMAKSFSEEQ